MFIWLLVLGMVTYFYRPFSAWPVVDEYSTVIVRTYISCLIVMWLLGWFTNAKTQRLPNIMILAILFYTLVATLSALVSPYYASLFESSEWRIWIESVVFFMVIVTSIKTERDLKIVLTVITVTLFVAAVHALMNYMAGNVVAGRGGGIRSIGALPEIVMFSFILPLLTLCKRNWHYLFVLAFVLASLRCMSLTGGRVTLIALVGVAVLFVCTSRHRFVILPVMFIVGMVLWAYTPDSIKNRHRVMWDQSADAGSARLTMEMRVGHFREGLQNWSDRPILGVGPGAHMYAAGHGMMAHNIYGQVAGELGTVGIAAFLFFLTCFGVNHYNIWKNYKYIQEKKLGKEGLYCWRVSQAVVYGVVAMLILGLGLHYALHFPWLWLAAFQIAAATFMQEKVTAAMQGKLLSSLPVRR